jgi:IS30 family transposase
MRNVRDQRAKKELLCHLRSKRTIRRSKQAGLAGDRRGQIKDLVSIRQRPPAVEDRAVPGHWEGDLLSGSKNSYIATLVERHTHYVMLAKMEGHPDGRIRAHEAGQKAAK